jgi:hypothetical protein
MHGEGRREGEGRSRETEASQLIDAAWAALIAGRPQELERLQALLESPPEAQSAPGSERKLVRLQLLIEHTARNLRILRGNPRPSGW